MQNTTVLTDDSATIIAEESDPFRWRLIFAGAAAAVATGFFLLVLGTGVGLRLVGPSSSAPTFLTMGAIWFLVSEAFGFAIGGYVLGRLIGPEVENTAEEEFRTSAHGLVMWAVTVVASLTIAAGAGFLAGATLVGSASPNSPNAVQSYLTDAMFWPAPNSAPVMADKAEAGRIMEDNLQRGNSEAALGRLTHLVSRDAGISTADARNQVLDAQAQLRATTDQARRAAGNAALWTALTLFFGAIIAVAATIAARWADRINFSWAPRR